MRQINIIVKSLPLQWSGYKLTLLHLLSFVQLNCCLPEHGNIHVFNRSFLSTVTFNSCDGRTRALFQSVDKRFEINTDGTVMLKREVTLHEGHKVFSVHAWDSSGIKHTASVRVERVPHQKAHEAMTAASAQVLQVSLRMSCKSLTSTGYLFEFTNDFYFDLFECVFFSTFFFLPLFNIKKVYKRGICL